MKPDRDNHSYKIVGWGQLQGWKLLWKADAQNLDLELGVKP